MDNAKLSETLKKALQMEERGYDFYKKLSEESKNNVTKKTFAFLAEKELLHIESIQNFYNTLNKTGELPSIDIEDKLDQREKDFTIFSKKISELNEKIKPDDDDVKACEFAMQLENDSYSYYENMLKEANQKALTALLRFLMKEETRHYEEIENLHTYLTDSHNWFMYEEGSFPQGG